MPSRLVKSSALAAAAAVLGTVLAHAQPPGRPEDGRHLASELCADCHRISADARDASSIPPDFGALADMPSLTALSLRVFLQTPHGNMPRYDLSPDEQDDLIAYLLSLRRP